MSIQLLDQCSNSDLFDVILQRLRIHGELAFKSGNIEGVEHVLEAYRSIEDAITALSLDGQETSFLYSSGTSSSTKPTHSLRLSGSDSPESL